MLIERKAFTFADLAAPADEPGRFTGKAAVYGNVDSYKDVMVPGSCAESIAAMNGRILVLKQHSQDCAIGSATLADAPDALYADGRLELELSDAREEYVRVKAGLVTGISIGYQTLEEDYADGVRYLKKVKLHEISLVTFPANSRARVTGVKTAETLMAETAEWLRELKEGRVLSAPNLKLVTDVRDSMLQVADQLSKLLEAAAPAAKTQDGPLAENTDADAQAQVDVETKALVEELLGLRHAMTTAIQSSTR